MSMRLVSLCPSITHTLFELGQGAHLVGITKFCVKPANAVATIEKVGGTKNPKLARILALRPDWVFLNREENRREDWQSLEQAGIRCHVSFPSDVASSIAMLMEMGECLQCANRAEELVAKIETVRQTIATSGGKTSHRTWAYLIWRKPWMTVNASTYIHGLVSEVAGANVFANKSKAYPEVSAEELAQASPDLILLSSEPFPFKQKHLEELAVATGLSSDRFRLVDGERLSWHGALTAEGLAYAYELFSGEKLAII